MVERQYVLIGVEGHHDQAFIEKILRKSFQFEKFNSTKSELDEFWWKFIPKYPNSGRLYQRLDMPSILNTNEISVAIYVGGGSNLIKNLEVKLSNINVSKLSAFAVIIDADKKSTRELAKKHKNAFKSTFPDFPVEPGSISGESTRLGIYIIPDNESHGVLDTILCQCGEIVYSGLMEEATKYLQHFSEEKRSEVGLRWKPFDYEKAKVATVASVLKPGKTNTTSLVDDKWISEETLKRIPALIKLNNFLESLLGIE